MSPSDRPSSTITADVAAVSVITEAMERSKSPVRRTIVAASASSRTIACELTMARKLASVQKLSGSQIANVAMNAPSTTTSA